MQMLYLLGHPCHLAVLWVPQEFLLLVYQQAENKQSCKAVDSIFVDQGSLYQASR